MDPIRFRCPKCRKLYSVAAADVAGDKPEFQCITCQAEFWFQFPPPADVVEAPTQLVDPAALNATSQAPAVNRSTAPAGETFACPACSFQNVKGTLDCAKCGIVFAKYNKKEAAPAASQPAASGGAVAHTPLMPRSVAASPSLMAAWDEIMSKYDVRELHEKFVQRCMTENNLPFASQQYRQILQANPQEDIAKAMRDRLITLTTATFIPPERVKDEGGRWGFSVILMVIGGLLILTGLISSDLRATAVVGILLVGAGIGLKKYMADS